MVLQIATSVRLRFTKLRLFRSANRLAHLLLGKIDNNLIKYCSDCVLFPNAKEVTAKLAKAVFSELELPHCHKL
jgi:hypothetical protein